MKHLIHTDIRWILNVECHAKAGRLLFEIRIVDDTLCFFADQGLINKCLQLSIAERTWTALAK